MEPNNNQSQPQDTNPEQQPVSPGVVTPAEPNNFQPQVPQQENKKPGKKLVTILVVLLVLALIGAGVYWFLSKDDSEDTVNNQQTGDSSEQVGESEANDSENDSETSLTSNLSELYFEEFPEDKGSYELVVSESDIKDSVTSGYQVINGTAQVIDDIGGKGVYFYKIDGGDWAYSHVNFGDGLVCSQFDDINKQKAYADEECFPDESDGTGSGPTVGEHYNL